MWTKKTANRTRNFGKELRSRMDLRRIVYRDK